MASGGSEVAQCGGSAPIPVLPWLKLIIGLVICCMTLVARAQETPHNGAKSDESGFVIRSQSNLIVVPVVVRDANGKPVSGLTRDDFEVFDNKKPQAISHFSTETINVSPSNAAEGETKSATPAGAPLRFIGLFFDDYHLEFGDLAQIQQAAKHYLEKNLDSGARVAIFSASGRNDIEFTRDRDKLDLALAKLHVVLNLESCPKISVYLAQRVEDGDQGALEVAKSMVLPCRCKSLPCPPMEFPAREESHLVLQQNEMRVRTTLTALDHAVRRMAELPGERSMAILSDGFLDAYHEDRIDVLIDHALRQHVVINALDARGLYATLPDESYARQGMQRQADILGEAAEGTGGVFIENTNDLEGGLARVESPHTTYILGFSPGNFKPDGQFHKLQVKLVNSAHLTVQARRGYFAPKGAGNSAIAEKEAMENAIFSSEDVRGLPIQISTKFVKVDSGSTKIDVTVAADLRSVQFRKADGRNLDDLTLIVVLFDGDGNYVTGQNQIVNLNLTDAELEKLKSTGGEGAAELNAKPGNYVVRAVVRESETKQLGAASRRVEIP